MQADRAIRDFNTVAQEVISHLVAQRETRVTIRVEIEAAAGSGFSCYVTRRKVSAGTRSDAGRDSRDAFLGLTKTCDKLGIPVWDYLGSRLKVAGHVVIDALDHYVRRRIRYA